MSHAAVEAAFQEFEAKTRDTPASMASFMADVLKEGFSEDTVVEWVRSYFVFHRRMQTEIGPDWFNHVGVVE